MNESLVKQLAGLGAEQQAKLVNEMIEILESGEG
ncbi:hypothetical protein SAMN05216339_10345 [Nitrosomonas eutropha]|uniref:Uncharacterized protein n=1 Tax=Nitrosomonas eutropha TaxID=916 RepID=A0A1I7GLP5_9PROT|nr:hypothetical protein SAMN05216339_10345 [Nitrosomonas eutropha]